MKKIAKRPLDWNNTGAVRTQLILLLRLLMLCRSVDLEIMYRTISKLDGQLFVLLKGKGQKKEFNGNL